MKIIIDDRAIGSNSHIFPDRYFFCGDKRSASHTKIVTNIKDGTRLPGA